LVPVLRPVAQTDWIASLGVLVRLQTNVGADEGSFDFVTKRIGSSLDGGMDLDRALETVLVILGSGIVPGFRTFEVW
jgi:hypothetical protein